MNQIRKTSARSKSSSNFHESTREKSVSRSIADNTQARKIIFHEHKKVAQQYADTSQLKTWDASKKNQFLISVLNDSNSTELQKFSVAKELIKTDDTATQEEAFNFLFSFIEEDEFESNYIKAAQILLESPNPDIKKRISNSLIVLSNQKRKFPKEISAMLASSASDKTLDPNLRFDAAKTLLDFSKPFKEKALDAFETIATDPSITSHTIRLDAARAIRTHGGEDRRTHVVRAYYSIAQIPSTASSLNSKLAAARVVADIADPDEQEKAIDILLDIAQSKHLGKLRLEAAQHAYNKGGAEVQQKALQVIISFTKPPTTTVNPTSVSRRPMRGGKSSSSGGTDLALLLSASSFLITKTDRASRELGLTAILKIAESNTASWQDRLKALDMLVDNQAFQDKVPEIISTLSQATSTVPTAKIKIAQLILKCNIEDQKPVALKLLETVLNSKDEKLEQKFESAVLLLEYGDISLKDEAIHELLAISNSQEISAHNRITAARIVKESNITSSSQMTFQAFITIAQDTALETKDRFTAVKEALLIHKNLSGDDLFSAYSSIAESASAEGTRPTIEHRLIAYRQALKTTDVQDAKRADLLNNLAKIASGNDLDGTLLEDPEMQFQAFVIFSENQNDLEECKTLAKEILESTPSGILKNYLSHFIETIEQPTVEDISILPSEEYSWPDSANLKFVKTLNSAIESHLYVDEKTGIKYIMKRGLGNYPEEQIRSEFTANRAYESLGIRVPLSMMYEPDLSHNKPFLLIEYLEDAVPLSDYMKNASDKEEEDIRSKLEEGFAADALLGNWNVLGEDQENILIYNGEPVRINVGDSLRFQTEGHRKEASVPLSTKSREEIDGFSKYPMDFWAMRGVEVKSMQRNDSMLQKHYPHTKDFFGNLDIFSLANQIIKLDNKKHSLMAHMPTNTGDINESNTLKRVIGLRLYYMRELADQAKKMQGDNWTPGYTDSMLMHRMGLRQSQIKKLMPENLVQQDNYDVRPVEYVNPFDTVHGEGGTFGGMRDPEGASTYLTAYTELYTGVKNSKFNFQKLMSEQGESSFSPMSMAYKYYLFKQQTNQSFDSYFWNGKSQAEMEALYQNVLKEENITEEQFGLTIQTGHAFTQELFRKTQFRYNNQSDKTIKVIRNIPLNIYKNADGSNLKAYKEDGSTIPIDKDFQGSLPDAYLLPKSALFDSTSVFRPFFSEFKEGEYGGTHLVEMTVDHHRVVGCYLSQRINKDDAENEFIIMSRGIRMENITSQDDYIQHNLNEDATDMVTHKYYAKKQPKKLG